MLVVKIREFSGLHMHTRFSLFQYTMKLDILYLQSIVSFDLKIGPVTLLFSELTVST